VERFRGRAARVFDVFDLLTSFFTNFSLVVSCGLCALSDAGKFAVAVSRKRLPELTRLAARNNFCCGVNQQSRNSAGFGATHAKHAEQISASCVALVTYFLEADISSLLTRRSRSLGQPSRQNGSSRPSIEVRKRPVRISRNRCESTRRVR
jgi:hypothetical protein